MTGAVLLAALAGLWSQDRPGATPGSPDGSPLQVGQIVTGTLGAGVAAWFDLVPHSGGPVTVSLESLDFDALVRIETGEGERVAQDDNGGVETNASATFDAKEGTPYRIVVGRARGGAGEYTLSVVAGAVPRVSGAELLEAAIGFRQKAADRALARGDKKGALGHRYLEANQELTRSRFPEAKAAYEACLLLARGLEDRPSEAKVLGNLGAVHNLLGNQATAREHLQRALGLARELGDRSGEAAALVNLGVVGLSLKEYGEALEQLELGLAVAREAGHRQWEANALSNLGLVTCALNDFAKARKLLEEYRALAANAGNRTKEAEALDRLGAVNLSLGEYATARKNFEKALSLRRELGDRSGEAAALVNLGIVHSSLGEYAAARQHAERGLALAREAGHRQWEANALGTLGGIYRSLGDHGQARELHERQLALAREEGDRSAQASAFGSLGSVFRSLGDYAKARDCYERSLALAREVGDRLVEAKTLANLGYVFRSLGDHGTARECFMKGLSVARKLGDRSLIAKSLGNMGNVYCSLGDFEKAREQFMSCLDLAEGLEDRQFVARVLERLGHVSYSVGDLAGALEAAGDAVVRFREIGAVEDALDPLAVVARVALARRDAPGALAAAREAQVLLERPSVRALGTPEAAGLRSRFSSWGGIAQDLMALRLGQAGMDAAARREILAEGFAAAGLWKGRALLEGIVEHRRGGRSREAIDLRRAWSELLARREAVLDRVSEAIRRSRPAAEVDGLKAEARALEDEAAEAFRRFREASPREAALDLPLGVEPGAVRRVIGPRALLVEFAEGEKRLYAYVLAGKDLAFLDLGSREDTSKAVKVFLRRITSPESPVAEVAEAGSRLYELLLAPGLRAAGEEVERLVVVPTAELAALPFESLVTGTRGDGPGSFADLEFVLDRWEVVYGPSSPVLVELAGRGWRPAGSKVLVLADPVYPSEPPRGKAGPEGPQASVLAWGERRGRPDPGEWPRLEETRAEALALAGLLEEGRGGGAPVLSRVEGRRSGSFASPAFDLHLGQEASRARLQGDLRPYGMLHLAAHGYVDHEFPQQGGLALSGRGEDVFFTIGEALDLDLDANLVVLSACQTARGEALAGEGIQSMARAFLHAGSRAVVASLWSVADPAAARTMTSFYREVLGRQISPAGALRGAKLALRRSKVAPGGAGRGRPDPGHPFHWAPFIYIGLPR